MQHGPAAETQAVVATELARCMNKTLGDMKRFHNIPQDHVNEMETLMKSLVERVARLATSFSQQAGDEKEPEESKNKRMRLVQKQPTQLQLDQGRTSAHDGIDGIDGANRRVGGYGRCHGVNIANLCVQRGRHEKRRWPVQVNEFKTPSAELGSKETPIQGPCHGARESEFMARSGSHHFSVAAGVLGPNETPFQGPCRRARKNEFVARSASHHFRVATANVRTLCDKGKSTAVTGSGALSGRAALLEIEMARCGLGIQEGRTQTDQIIEGAEYTMVVAGADARANYGTQLWVRRSLRAKVTGVPVSTPRLLVAWLRFEMSGSELMCVVGHQSLLLRRTPRHCEEEGSVSILPPPWYVASTQKYSPKM